MKLVSNSGTGVGMESVLLYPLSSTVYTESARINTSLIGKITTLEDYWIVHCTLLI